MKIFCETKSKRTNEELIYNFVTRNTFNNRKLKRERKITGLKRGKSENKGKCYSLKMKYQFLCLMNNLIPVGKILFLKK